MLRDCPTLEEIRQTYEYKWTKGLLTRFEYRRDWMGANMKGFENELPAMAGLDHSDAMTLGVVALVGPK